MENLKKLHFQIKLAGWLGVLPSALTLYLYQNTHATVYLILVIVCVLLSLYMILTGNYDSWNSRGKILGFIILTFLFAGLLPAIPLMFALRYVTNNNSAS